MSETDKPMSMLDNAKMGLGICLFFVRIFSQPMQLLLSFDVGERALGLSIGWSLLSLIIWPLCFPTANPAPMFLLLMAFFFRVICHRLLVIKKWYYGQLGKAHTRRSGMPWAARLTSRWSPDRIAIVQAFALSALGFGVKYLNRPLGVYFVVAGIAMLAAEAIGHAYRANDDLDRGDALFEQQYRAERMRDMQDR